MRCGSPRPWWYSRANLIADSAASEPELTKNVTPRSPGASSAISAAVRMAGGCAAAQFVAKDICFICAAAASAMSSRPWPMFTQNRPARPSMYRRPLSSHR